MLLRPLKILLSTTQHQTSRCCSSYVSRMRYMNHLKQDDSACEAALQSGHVFLFHRLSPLLTRTDQGNYRPTALRSTELCSLLDRLGSDRALLKESVLIGCSEDEQQAQFCLDVGELDQAAVEAACGGSFIDLRKSFFLLTGGEAPLVAKGQALLRWNQSSRFCSATGEPTNRNAAGSQRVCEASGIIYYPKMSPVVIVLVSDGKRCLLGRQKTFPRGMYSALAGFCDMGETLEETLGREIAEEVGLEVESLTYSSSQHWPFPHSSFMLACHATVNPAKTELKVDFSELEDARWFGLDDITEALKLTPPTRGHAHKLWLPPKHAVAHRLITEWTLTHCQDKQ